MATVDDYIPTLRNADVLQRFRGRGVCDVTRSDIMKAVDEKRLQGVRTHHKKVLVVCRNFFAWLAEDARPDQTSVQPDLLTTAKAGEPLMVTNGIRYNKGVPAAGPIGRALAIARSGVLGDQPSEAIQTVIGTLQRRHAVCAMLERDIRFFEGRSEDGSLLRRHVWFVPPAHRKTTDNIQSSSAHQIPLVGFVEEVLVRRCGLITLPASYADGRHEEEDVRWTARRDGKEVLLLDHAHELDGLPAALREKFVGILPYDRLFPQARVRRKGQAPKQAYMSEDTLNHNMAAMPGVAGDLSPHALRRKFASEGIAAKVMEDGESKLILDHLEGSAGDVTRGHYDLDPRLPRKRELLG